MGLGKSDHEAKPISAVCDFMETKYPGSTKKVHVWEQNLRFPDGGSLSVRQVQHLRPNMKNLYKGTWPKNKKKPTKVELTIQDFICFKQCEQ